MYTIKIGSNGQQDKHRQTLKLQRSDWRFKVRISHQTHRKIVENHQKQCLKHISRQCVVEESLELFISRHIPRNLKAKSSSQMGISDVSFTRCLPIAFTPHRHATERENIFWPNCGKFAVECDWNNKISRKAQNLGFFWKHLWVFGKKLKIFAFSKCGNFTVECVSKGISS